MMKVAVILVILFSNVLPNQGSGELPDSESKEENFNSTELAESDKVSGEEETLKEDLPKAEKLLKFRARPTSRCYSSGLEGACYTKDDCLQRGGKPTGVCGSPTLICCTFVFSCQGMSGEKVTYFRSPHYPFKSRGSIACDYDVKVLASTCAVRVEFLSVNLARKLGGACDIDSILILNSADGPTSGQCGPLTGYSTTVATNPGQGPVKIAALIQNEASYYWDIKLTQLACNQGKDFSYPLSCGQVQNDILTSNSNNHVLADGLQYWYDKDGKWKNSPPIWWDYPEPIFNTFYYGSTKRHLQQHGMRRFSGFLRRVVSGRDAYVGEFPWVVAVGLDNMFFCGGALLNDRYVLTAAHCIMARDTPIGSLIVHLGDLDLTHHNDTMHIARTVSKVIYHSHFHPFLLANDIALLQLNQSVPFTDTIQPVCLPPPDNAFIGRIAAVVGWGVTSFPMGEPSPILQKLDVEVLSNFQCSKMIEEPVTAGMVCAAPLSLQGTCFGDSGGPLTVEVTEGRHTLVGIVSFGVTGCAVTPAFPDLYTRVSEYTKWIEINAI